MKDQISADSKHTDDPLPLISGLRPLQYVYQPEHYQMAEGATRAEGPNIGASGEHLTIMFLSLNRLPLSTRLCQSVIDMIPGFKGEILAIDNGSTAEHIRGLRTLLESLPCRTRLVELGANHGVAGGRNRGVDHVHSDWVLSLDNDIFFVRNPLSVWQREMAITGCRFMTLPLFDPGQRTVFLRGGHIYIQDINNHTVIGGGSVVGPNHSASNGGDAFLGTCMMGGASIFHKTTFQRLGGYDASMFVGFEDIEFSLRLFREGYKIGCSNQAALVHDHPRPETTEDRDYEKQRFALDTLKASAAHFESKHGFRVWHQNVETWLTERQRTLGLHEGTHEPARSGGVPIGAATTTKEVATLSVTNRPKVLLIADISGWAFANISRQIKEHLSSRFEITITASHELKNMGQIALLAQRADLVHFFWRADIAKVFGSEGLKYAAAVGYRNPRWLFDHLISKYVTTSVYDHLHLDEAGITWMRPIFQSFVDGYTVSSQKLWDIYQQILPAAPPTAIASDGVDLDLFRPRLDVSPADQERPLVLGWVGNSKWGAELEDFKGFHTIIEPAIESLRREGLAIETAWCDRFIKHTPHKLMPDYYHKIDVLLCASKIEGTPNPVLEAMASGLTVISTDVGIVRDVFGPLQSRFILKNRTVHDLRDAIRHIYYERSALASCGTENLSSISAWRWQDRAQAFRHFFDAILRKPAKPKALLV